VRLLLAGPLAEVLADAHYARHSLGEKRRKWRFFSHSPGRTRTYNPPVNSRMLCQLSYRGRQAGF
jgi:hypothetical protein